MSKSIKTILTSVLAMAVMVLGLSFTPVMQLTAGAADLDISEGIQGGADLAKSDDQAESLFGDGGIFQTITNTALFIIGAVSVLMLIYGGIRYTLSAGDSNSVEAAKNTIMYAIIGVVVAVLAYAIVNFVLTSLID